MSSVKSASKSGGIDGGLLAAGEITGRQMMGPAGVAVGGILAAATESGEARDRMATMAIERAANEVFGY